MIANRRRVLRKGMGLVEALVALSIAASLLTATAVALTTAVKAYQINQQQAGLLQQTRLAMNRMLSTIRRNQLHQPDSSTLRTQFAAGATVTDTAIDMFDASSTEITYKYDATNKRVNMIVGGTTRPLIEGVETFTVKLEPMRSATSVRTGGPWDLLKRATILITVKPNSKNALGTEGKDEVTLTLSASVMPRRNTL
jgi:Tfp pilus assembly protein PilW